jgi:cell division septation protein DedD
MKLCPTCQSTYTDDSMRFCLEDGAPLQPVSVTSAINPTASSGAATAGGQRAQEPPATEIFDPRSAPTAQMPGGSNSTASGQPRPTDLISQNFGVPGTQSASTVERPNSVRTIALTVLGTVLLICLGGLGAWLLFGGNESGRRLRRDRATERAINSQEVLSNSSSQTTNASASPTASPKSVSDNQAATQTQNVANSNAASKETETPKGKWLVLLGSYTKAETGKANERLKLVRSAGYDARIVETDDYPNLRAGLLAVVMGPFTRREAHEVVSRVRNKVPDAFAKSGW